MRILRLFSFFCCFAVIAADSPQFRGPDRNGKFPEKGLMREWPADGPKELWSVKGLGAGYSSLAIVDGVLFVTGKPFDEEGKPGDEEFVSAYDTKGGLKWKTSLGPGHSGGGFPGSRTTPTVDGDSIYVMNSNGVLYRIERASGKEQWKVNLTERFEGAKLPYFGFAESVLIEGDHVLCTPGGPKSGLAALNKATGETVWSTEALSDPTGYCSMRIFDNGKHRQAVTMTGKSMVGVDPKNGALLWRQDYPAEYDIHAVSPVFHGNYIYVSDGYKQGGKMFELNEDGKGVTFRWEEKTLDCHHGGLVNVDGAIYGASDKGQWIALDFKTGKVITAIDGVGKGAAIYADGLIIGYSEKGQVGLFNASSPEKFALISSFEITKGNGQHWSHPVVNNGVLYVRHGDELMAYAIK